MTLNIQLLTLEITPRKCSALSGHTSAVCPSTAVRLGKTWKTLPFICQPTLESLILGILPYVAEKAKLLLPFFYDYLCAQQKIVCWNLLLIQKEAQMTCGSRLSFQTSEGTWH